MSMRPQCDGCETVLKERKHRFEFPIELGGTKHVWTYTHTGPEDLCSRCLSSVFSQAQDRLRTLTGEGKVR